MGCASPWTLEGCSECLCQVRHQRMSLKKATDLFLNCLLEMKHITPIYFISKMKYISF